MKRKRSSTASKKLRAIGDELREAKALAAQEQETSADFQADDDFFADSDEEVKGKSKSTKKRKVESADRLDSLRPADLVVEDDETVYTPSVMDVSGGSKKTTGDEQKMAKKKEKFAALKQKKAAVAASSSSSSSSPSPSGALLKAEDQATFVWAQFTTAFKNELSDIENSELQATSFISHRTPSSPSLDDFPAVIKSFCPTYQAVFNPKKIKDAGSPPLIVLTWSANRACDFLRAMRHITKDTGGNIAQLYARHFKVEKQIEFLQQKVAMAVGTPGRVLKLADSGALGIDRAKYIFIDMQKNEKNFNIFEIHETRKDLMDLLRKYVLKPMQDGSMKMMLF